MMPYLGTIAYRAALGGRIDEAFCASLVSAWNFLLHAHFDSHEEKPIILPRFNFIRGLGCMLHDNANQIAESFLGEWVLFLDTDHVFASDALYEMIQTFEENQLDILTGFAQKRQPPYLPLIFKTDFDAFKGFEPIIPTGVQKHTLIPIDSSGLGCLLVRRTVFQAISDHGERPFDMRKKFNASHLKNRSILNPVFGTHTLPKDRHIDEVFWEDVSFYWRAKMLGFQAWCAPWIKFHHIEQRLVRDAMIGQME